jgi:hypothetical protein
MRGSDFETIQAEIVPLPNVAVNGTGTDLG